MCDCDFGSILSGWWFLWSVFCWDERGSWWAVPKQKSNHFTSSAYDISVDLPWFILYPFFFPWNGLKWSISDSQESAICLFTARASKQNEIPGSTPWWVISRFLVYMIFYDAQHLCSKQMQNFFHQVIRHVTSGSLPQWFIPDPTLSELSQDHDSKGIGKKGNLIKETLPAWWFGTFGLFFHILDIIWNNNPTWLIFSRGVEPPTSF